MPSYDECATLFDFALDCARRSPDISFVLRPHPMVDIRSLLHRLPFLRNLPGNVSLSVDKPLEQEFAQTRYCLYRGSSAAMHAARAGIKPYYFARPGELSFDCLFELGDWREAVTSPQDLLNRMSLADQSSDSAAAMRAAEFLRTLRLASQACRNQRITRNGRVHEPAERGNGFTGMLTPTQLEERYSFNVAGEQIPWRLVCGVSLLADQHRQRLRREQPFEQIPPASGRADKNTTAPIFSGRSVSG